jgi:23S rRNA (adenine1618-N6)-methyltransferase
MENEKGLHPRNVHNDKYDFDALIKDHPPLASFVKKNKYDALGVDFSDPDAVLNLNQALMGHHYQVKNWSVPKGHLCPPIPSRANYIHYIADILSEEFEGNIPVGTKVKGLDIGTGTSCIYPILGNSIYGWKFVGSDISSDAINHGNLVLKSNSTLKKNIKLRYQEDANNIFEDIIKFEESFDFAMCNPPFHASLEEANSASARKVRNLNINKEKKGHEPISKSATSNFGGIKAELWCPGGEVAFIKKMIEQSVSVKDQCRWFTTLVSNKTHLEEFDELLKKLRPAEVRTIEMHQGKKVSHVLAWRF